MSLTKVQIVNSIANQIGFAKKKSTETMETLLEITKKALESGDDVMITGFGKFCVKEKKERRGRNSSTGEDMMAESGSLKLYQNRPGPVQRKCCLKKVENIGLTLFWYSPT